MAMIKDNILQLQNDISLICQRLGRNPGEITLVVVTKFATVPMMEEALKCGISHMGENKVQEAQKKFQTLNLSKIKVTRHMIGHLQTNKAKDALGIFDVIQSVDSIKLATTIEKTAEKLKRQVDILIQVNTSGEEQKYGVASKEVPGLLRQVSKFSYLRAIGLMTMAPLTENQKVIRDCFRKLRELRDQVKNELTGCHNITMDFLSMGMSSDYRIALEEGANMVRIGRAIFSHV